MEVVTMKEHRTLAERVKALEETADRLERLAEQLVAEETE
jgi:hypothetical protein